MPQPSPPPLYKQYFIDRSDERVDLFRKLAEQFGVRSALYPGSFVQISPSFVIPRVVYVDSDRRIPRFFGDPAVQEYVESRKEYGESPEIRYHHQSYEDDIGEPPGNFDLLISQYAGFISAACKRYLKRGGLLVANDSHGDASMARIDPDFELVAAIDRRGEKFSVKTSDLDRYFLPKRPVEITAELLRQRGRGIGYTTPASSYLFRKIG